MNEKMMNDLDQGNDQNVPEELKKDHELIKKGIDYILEESFRSKLEQAEKFYKKSSFLNFRFYATSGIAACLALALFWFSSDDSASESIELQMEEVPAYADSASYDSLKELELNVDIQE